MMDLQQILALVTVAVAAASIVYRVIRKRKNLKFRECADCPATGGETHAKISTPGAGSDASGS